VAQLTAQDIHFSQYWMTPIALSPAMTGAHNGLVRAGAVYRNQWFTFGQANYQKPQFITYGVSGEVNFFYNKLHPDKFSVGLSLIGDRAGDGALTTQAALVSIAYHKAIDRYGRHVLALGLQAGFVQKRIFVNDLLFSAQLDESNLVFDAARWNQESPAIQPGADLPPIRYPDANFGIMWSSAPVDRFRYYATFSMFHVARPVETFYPELNLGDNRLDHRFSVNFGFELDISERFTLSPSFYFQTQAKAREFLMGTALITKMSEEVDLFFGVWSRVDFETQFDAVYPVLGVNMEKFGLKTGISYDVNVSDLRLGTNSHGALEITALYTYRPPKWKSWRLRSDHYCPRF
jgi:type IX secretion system PorP/SprF family membrane protein